jgi:eukaryotic-like serine/threonine-protein kinase
MSLPLHDFYRFDEFELSRSRRTLLRDGTPVPLLPKTFEVLTCLVSNPGRVLSKEEIFRTVWPESFVEENNLTQHISLLRKAFADRSGYIVTIPGRGYQFTAAVVSPNGVAPLPGQGAAADEPGIFDPVSRLPNHATAPDSALTAPAPDVLQPRVRRSIPRWARFCATGAVLAALSATGFTLWRRWTHPPGLRSVVVADFLNSTGDATFDHTLKRALEIDLEQSPHIDVMSEREAMTTLALMGRGKDVAITGDLAREICGRSNRQVLLIGTIQSVGHEYLLTVEAAECATGRKLTAAKAEASTKEQVLAALDSVADRVRRILC